MICEKTLKDRVTSELIQEMTGVKPLKEFLKSQRLRWFQHIKQTRKEKAPAMAMTIMVEGKKKI